jgi:hypothetical protein
LVVPNHHLSAIADCRDIVSDYAEICDLIDLIGPLDFDGFCAGYLEHGAWRVTREHRELRVRIVVEESNGEEQRDGATYAA